VRVIRSCLILALLPALGPGLAAAPGKPAKLYPADEASQDPSFVAFRTGLLEALAKKDKAFVIGILDPDIKFSFGDDHGVAGFERHWELDRPQSSQLWQELTTVLSLGGRFRETGGAVEFWAPYTFADFPNDWDAFESAVILGANVNVRAGPGTDTPILEQLTFDIVRTSDQDGGEWVKIVSPSGKEGYVARRYIRSPIDYRAAFVKGAAGAWRMRLLVAGD
jgi:SH3 domain-containing protein